MSKIDFFEYSKKVKPVPEFGLIDKQPADIDYDDKEKDKWNAIVECNNRRDYLFSPLDKKIRIPKGQGEEESLCECILNTKDTIAFVELKDDKTSDYRRKAEKQLENTLRIFKQNNDIDKYIYKKAYICNKRRLYYNVTKNSICSDFAKRNGVSLHIGINIEEFE